MTTSVESLTTLLAGCVGEPTQIRMAEIDRRAMAHDASHFLLLPSAIVAPRDADEVGPRRGGPTPARPQDIKKKIKARRK